MKTRSDYRSDYKDWTKERILNHLPVLKEKLLKNIGICESNVQFYSKRISYLENKI